MPRRRWTVVVVPPGAGDTKSLRVSLFWLRFAIGGFAALALTALALGYFAVSKGVALNRLDRLQRYNEVLAEELDQTQTRLQDVSSTIGDIMSKDTEVRLLAGLEPRDADVQLAGVGGPRGTTTERELALSEGSEGMRALEMSKELSTMIRRADLLSSSFEAAAETLKAKHERLSRTPSIMPTQGYLASNFSQARMHPIVHKELPHEGIDIAAPMGTPILSAAAGRVRNVSRVPGYGLIVTVEHRRGLVTRYAHCSKHFVEVGKWVERGEKIAEVGNSGIVTAPHLHYEVIVNGRAQDPRKWVFADDEIP
jgi:murein DD-endopeptidase MepM/ murein hydrolase activator NlpD